VEIEALDRVVKETLAAIESGQEAIYNIAENTRSEYERVQQELMATQRETLDTIQKVDHLSRLEKEARLHLMIVSRDFNTYSEEEVKEAYERAMELKSSLLLLQEQEKNLRQRRNELERSLRRLSRIVEQAETLVTKLSVVLQFLQGTINEINSKIGDIQKQQKLGLKIILVQEEERRRIAREIHDGPAQELANLVLRAEYCEQLLLHDDLTQLRTELSKLKEIARNTLKDIRKTIFDLRPMSLDDLGLAGEVPRLIQDFQERYKIPVEYHLFGKERRYSKYLEVTVFRIIQEALNNIQKHAGASEVVVKLELHPERIYAVIQDDGKGFDVQSAMNLSDHYGLLNMRERANIFKGELNVNSAPGKGTEIILVIPVNEEGETNGED